MRELTVPQDPWAEASVVGCAIATRRGATLARARIKPEDLWDPKLRCMYVAALEVDADDEGRIEAIARKCGFDATGIHRVANDRAVMWDLNASFSRRVLDASRRRAAMTWAARIYNALGAGATLAEVAGEVACLKEAASW